MPLACPVAVRWCRGADPPCVPVEGHLLAARSSAEIPPPHLVRKDHRASRAPAAPLSPDRQLRLAGRQRQLERHGPASPGGRRGRLVEVRSPGDLRGDLPDRGLLRDDVALVREPGLLRPEVHRRGVQGEGLHLLRAALRLRRVHQQRDRRDQGPDGLHGRLPADDAQGHLHHQRHRAGRRLAAGPLPGRLLRAHRRQDLRQGHLHRQADPEPRRVAGVRDRQARHGRRPPRPQAQAERHGAAQGPRLDQRADPRGVRPVRVDDADPGEGPHPGPGRRAARHLPQAAPGRAAHA